MEVLRLIVPLALAFAGLAGMGFVWCVRNRQYSDPKGAAHRMLIDEDDQIL